MIADASDNGQVTREELEARAVRGIIKAERLADALDLLEAAVAQVGGSDPPDPRRAPGAGTRARDGPSPA